MHFSTWVNPETHLQSSSNPATTTTTNRPLHSIVKTRCCFNVKFRFSCFLAPGVRGGFSTQCLNRFPPWRCGDFREGKLVSCLLANYLALLVSWLCFSMFFLCLLSRYITSAWDLKLLQYIFSVETKNDRRFWRCFAGSHWGQGAGRFHSKLYAGLAQAMVCSNWTCEALKRK